MSDSEHSAYIRGKCLGPRHQSQALDLVLFSILSRGSADNIGAPDVPHSGISFHGSNYKGFSRTAPGLFAHSADTYRGRAVCRAPCCYGRWWGWWQLRVLSVFSGQHRAWRWGSGRTSRYTVDRPRASVTWGDPEGGGHGAGKEATDGPELRGRCQGAESAVESWALVREAARSPGPDRGLPSSSLAPACPEDAFGQGADPTHLPQDGATRSQACRCGVGICQEKTGNWKAGGS